MTLQQLKYIVTIAELENISSAAQKLFVSQPSLTNAIKSIEEELHITVFKRLSRGVKLTREGEEFVGYAKQVIEQVDILENHYSNRGTSITNEPSVSTLHFGFAVSAYIRLIKEFPYEKYNFRLRETQTYEVIEDVINLVSEIGIIFLTERNKSVIKSLLFQNNLIFHDLFVTTPKVIMSEQNPLANKEMLTLDELEPYPYIYYEQGSHNSLSYSEQLFAHIPKSKNIQVRDRATLVECMFGLNGYTISCGIFDNELNPGGLVALPLEYKAEMRIGYVSRANIFLSPLIRKYIDYLNEYAPNINEGI